MLMRTDPFRDLDRLTQQAFGTPGRPAAMPIDAYRMGDRFVVEFDLPGVATDSIDLTVERNVLTVHATRSRVQDEQTEMLVAERPYGTFSRQLFLGETLDADHIGASYRERVLRLEIPVAEQAKPKKVAIQSEAAEPKQYATERSRCCTGTLAGGPAQSRGRPSVLAGPLCRAVESIARLLRCLMMRVRRADPTDWPAWRACKAASIRGTVRCQRPSPDARELEDELISLMSNLSGPTAWSALWRKCCEWAAMSASDCPPDMRGCSWRCRGRAHRGYMLFVEYPGAQRLLELLAAFSGLERENVTRGPGWVFMNLGRRLERAMYSVRQLREITSGLDKQSWPLLEYLLEVEDSSMTYRSRYFTTLQPVAVLDVLLADESNPRSLSFQLAHLADLYQRLPA